MKQQPGDQLRGQVSDSWYLQFAQRLEVVNGATILAFAHIEFIGPTAVLRRLPSGAWSYVSSIQALFALVTRVHVVMKLQPVLSFYACTAYNSVVDKPMGISCSEDFKLVFANKTGCTDDAHGRKCLDLRTCI